MTTKHYVYGSGMSGCLYDCGPNYAETLESAIDGALCIFDLPEEEIAEARAELRKHGIYYFPSEWRGDAGADYVQITEADGPCPEGDE